jgi:arylsulfatase A-like enzyme
MLASLTSAASLLAIPRARQLVAGLLLATTYTLASLGLGPMAVQAAPPEPDIIVFMVDDLGYIQNDRIIKRLPNIYETFRQDGMRFTQMHNETPLCGPSRASTLTGQHTLHHGVTRNDGDLLKPKKTLAHALRTRGGYHTGLVGKYLNNYSGPRPPVGWDQASIFYRDGQRLKDESTRLVRKAPSGQPLFAWIASTAPHKAKGSHQPYVADAYRGAAQCRGITPFKPSSYRVPKTSQPFPKQMPKWYKGWPMTRICESMLVIDETVGQVVQAQKERGRPAYFIFMSDNGMAWGQHGYPGKHNPFATKLPFYMAGPGISGGTTAKQLLSIIDIAPTLTQIADVSMPWVDGKSFLPALEGRKFSGRSRMLEIYPHPQLGWKALRKTGWHYIRDNSGRRQLYKTSTDPWQRRNLVNAKPAKVRELNRELNRLLPG